MPRPTTRNGTANVLYRRRIPEDVRRILDGLPDAYRPEGWGRTEITITLGTGDPRKAAAEHARISDRVEQRIAGLREGVRSLSRKQAVALAGLWYKIFVEACVDEPWAGRDYERMLALNRAATLRRDLMDSRSSTGRERVSAGGARDDPMEERFGLFVDLLLGLEALIVDAETRQVLLLEIAHAMDDAGKRNLAATQGDYRPDPAAERFPDWERERPQARPPKLSMPDLFARWADHPEQANTARRTKSRYKGVFAAVADFLDDPDAQSVTADDVSRYLEARMADTGPGRLQPKVARDVHKAALSSVYGWAVGKRIVAGNPATDVSIKVKRAKRLRQKEASDRETRELVGAILELPQDAPPRSPEAAIRWCLLIALYTGCRIGEACQLRKKDFAGGGLPMIRITPEAGDVKDGEPRDLPVHPRLVEVGLLAFVDGASPGPLFCDPGRRRNETASTPQAQLLAADLATWARGHGLGDPLLTRPLHALRHRFMTVARNADVGEQYLLHMAGHEPGSVNGRYGSYPPEALHREIAKLSPAVVEGRA